MNGKIKAAQFVPEMLRMREEGKSNKFIAETYGYSVQTIRTLIGPQGPGIRRECVRNASPKPYREPEVGFKEEPQACLVVADREISLEGTAGHYDIALKPKQIKICMADGAGMKLDFEKFIAFVDEVNAIKRKLDGLKIENEMW